MHPERIDQNRNGDEPDQQAVNPLTEDLQRGVGVTGTARVFGRIGVVFPPLQLLFLADGEGPRPEALRPIWTRFACVEDANGASSQDDDGGHGHQPKREKGGTAPPRSHHSSRWTPSINTVHLATTCCEPCSWWCPSR